MYNTNNGMYNGYEVESSKEMAYSENKSSKMYEEVTGTGAVSSTPMMSMNMGCNSGIVMPPVYECPQERIIHREYVHTVPHVCPINTKIVNHHIYKHTYSPCYTCCEENEVCNVTEGCCNNF